MFSAAIPRLYATVAAEPGDIRQGLLAAGAAADELGDIWLRGEHHATTHVIAEGSPAPADWTDGDVVAVLNGMLRALDRRKNPDAAEDRPIALRGFSWIVNPFEEGGVVIAIEIQMGAAIAGPFSIDKGALEAMITRVLAVAAGPAGTVH